MHNKVNKKLGVKDMPNFEKVCSRYATYKASCDKLKKGCIYGKNNTSKRCKIQIEPLHTHILQNESKIRALSIPEMKKTHDLFTKPGKIDNATSNNILILCDKIVASKDPQLLKNLHNLLMDVNGKKKTEWLIFGKDTCPYCQNAKQLAHDNNLDFTYIDINEMSLPEKTKLYAIVEKKINPVTIPMIFRLKEGKYAYFGGFSALKRFKKTIV